MQWKMQHGHTRGNIPSFVSQQQPHNGYQAIHAVASGSKGRLSSDGSPVKSMSMQSATNARRTLGSQGKRPLPGSTNVASGEEFKSIENSATAVRKKQKSAVRRVPTEYDRGPPRRETALLRARTARVTTRLT